MNEENLQLAIDKLQRKSLPECPGNLEANVWRRINLQRDQVGCREQSDFFQWLIDCINHRRVLSYACVASIAYGVIFSGVIIAMTSPDQTNDLMELRGLVNTKSLMMGE